MITAGDVIKYVRDDGARCPKCGSSNIEGQNGFQIDGGTGFQGIECLSCGLEWEDRYALIGIAGIAEDENYLPFAIRGKQGVIRLTGNSVMISLDGYEEKTGDEWNHWPIVIENYQGEIHVHVWSDVNSEDCISINMSKARKENRRGEK